MEARLGTDLGAVRVHTGARADASTRALEALAYTVGPHVVVRSDRYPASTPESTHLLAHELAHTVQQRQCSRGLVQRAPDPRAPTEDDRRVFVRDTTEFLKGAQDFFTQLAQIKPNASQFGDAPVRHTLERYRTMMSDQGAMVLDDLHGDAALYRPLRAAYQGAVGALLAGAAHQANKPVAELYETYRSLVLEWAIPTQTFSGITTPLPLSARRDPRTGHASVAAGGVAFSFAPDRPMTRAEARAAGNEARTHIEGHAQTGDFDTDKDGKITRFDPATFSIDVQTRYPAGLTASTPAGRGRGKTPEDVAAGNTSLGFHEGSHGADFLRFAREHPQPVFGGQISMTPTAYKQATDAFVKAAGDYIRAMCAYSVRSTDGPGSTVASVNQLVQANCRR
jgi:hypothetical protein